MAGRSRSLVYVWHLFDVPNLIFFDKNSGSMAPSFYNVHFNNGTGNIMAITNTQGIQISGQVQFDNGITTTVRNNSNMGALRFAHDATYTGANTDTQHVDGYVSKTGNTAFTFPVGSSTDLRTLSISALASLLTEISTAWFAGNPGTVTLSFLYNDYKTITGIESSVTVGITPKNATL